MAQDRYSRSLSWPSEFLRRGSDACREHYGSGDYIVIAKKILEATIRHEGDARELIRQNLKT